MNKLDFILQKYANNNYKLKKFSHEFRLSILLLLVFKILTSIISFFAGIYFFKTLLLPLFNDVTLSLVLSIILLCIIEILTQIFISKLFKFSFRKQYSTALSLLLVVALCFTVSFHSSTQGLALRQKNKSDKTITINEKYNLLEQNIEKKYTDNSQLIRAEIDLIKRQTWRGKLSRIHIDNIKQYYAKLDKLKDDFIAEKNALKNAQKNELKSNEKNTKNIAKKYYTVIAIVMFFQLLVNFILMFCFKKIYSEKDPKNEITEDIELFRKKSALEIQHFFKQEIINAYKFIKQNYSLLPKPINELDTDLDTEITSKPEKEEKRPILGFGTKRQKSNNKLHDKDKKEKQNTTTIKSLSLRILLNEKQLPTETAKYLKKHKRITELLIKKYQSPNNRPKLVDIAKKTNRSRSLVDNVKRVLDEVISINNQ